MAATHLPHRPRPHPAWLVGLAWLRMVALPMQALAAGWATLPASHLHAVPVPDAVAGVAQTQPMPALFKAARAAHATLPWLVRLRDAAQQTWLAPKPVDAAQTAWPVAAHRHDGVAGWHSHSSDGSVVLSAADPASEDAAATAASPIFSTATMALAVPAPATTTLRWPASFFARYASQAPSRLDRPPQRG